MFYSIIPAEIVFDEWDGKEMEKYFEITYENCQVIVEPLEDNQARIVQLISSDPVDFLNGRVQPGTMIKYTPPLS